MDDGGGIYVTYSEDCIIRGNIIEDSIGNCDGRTGTTTQAQGIYLDNCANNMEVLDNTVINCDNGFNIHNTEDNEISGNTVYLARKSAIRLNEDDSQLMMENNVVEGNIFFTDIFADACCIVEGDFGDTDYVTFDNNYYAQPLTNFAFKRIVPAITAWFRLPEWQAAFGNDANSASLEQFYDFKYSCDSSECASLFVNYTATADDLSLDQEYFDLYQNSISGTTINVGALSAKLMIKKDALRLKSHWKLDEASGYMTYDAGICANNGTITDPIWTTGKTGGALNFSGSWDNVVSVVHDTSLDFTENDNFSISYWIKFPEEGCSYHLAKGYPYNGTGYGIASSNGTDPMPQFFLRDGSTRIYLYGGSTSREIWTHYAWTIDRTTNILKAYKNGSYTGQVDISSLGSVANTYNLTIGAGQGMAFTGSLDDVRIYNYVLDEMAIRELGNTLVSHWEFDEVTGSTAYDTGGDGNDGTVNNATWIIGKIGGALSCDGNSDYVDVGDSPFDISSSMSICGWFYISDTTSNQEGLVWKSSAYGIGFGRTNNGGVADQFGFHVYDGSTMHTANSGSITTGWHYVCGVFDDDADEVRIYLDGNLKNSVTMTGSIALSNSQLRIGGIDYGDGTGWFDGLIDDLRIYRTALSGGNIQYFYDVARLAGHWKLDEIRGNAVHDASIYKNHGTVREPDWGTGEIGGALSFSGSWDNVVSVVHDTSLDFTENDNFSISYWIKFPEEGCSYHLAKGYPYNGTGYGIASSNGTDPMPQFFLRDGSTRIYLYGGSTSREIWTHYAWTIDRTTNILKAYKNGSYTGQVDISSLGSVANTYNLTIGAGQGMAFTGSLDDVRIYNYNLGSAEVLALYNLGQ